MDIFESNYKFLTEHYPALLQSIDYELRSDGYSEYTVTRSNEPNLRLVIEGRPYFLHSKYNAKGEAEKWIETIKEKVVNSKHIFIMGVGLGYFLEELINATESQDIFIYEPSVQVFSKWILIKDVRKTLSNPKIRFFALGNNSWIPMQIANNISKNLSGSLAFIFPPVYERMYPILVRQMEMQIKENITQQISRLQTVKLNQTTWLENIMLNIPYLTKCPSIAELKDKWRHTGVKAVVVGSGPSLSKDIHYLAQLRNKCLIIAAGSSIQAMEHFGIKPHFVVSMDGSSANYKVFENINVTKTPLIFCPHINYSILDNYKADMYYSKFEIDTVTNYLLDKETSNIPTFLSTASVSGTAIQIAEFMGITDIILLGQDLSYSNNEYYASGVIHVSEEDKIDSLSNADQWVENVEGGRNRTKGSMQVLLKDMEALVEIMKLRGVNITNASQGGAKINGTEFVTMGELVPQIAQIESRNFEVFSEITPISTEVQHKRSRVIKDKLQEILRLIVKMEAKLDKVNEEISKLSNGITSRNIDSINRSLICISKHWDWITNQDLFKIFYSYSLDHYINIYMRYVPEIVETTNVIRKGELIQMHLGALINHMKRFNPELEVIVKKALLKQRNVEFDSVSKIGVSDEKDN